MDGRKLKKSPKKHIPKFIIRDLNNQRALKSNPCLQQLSLQAHEYLPIGKVSLAVKQNCGYVHCLEQTNIAYMDNKDSQAAFLKSKLYHSSQYAVPGNDYENSAANSYGKQMDENKLSNVLVLKTDGHKMGMNTREKIRFEKEMRQDGLKKKEKKEQVRYVLSKKEQRNLQLKPNTITKIL